MAKFKNMKAVIKQLEHEHKDRNLKFITPFIGAVPVQAWGTIDGLRFYFRFRSNLGNLRVGPYVRELEVLFAQRVNEDREARRLEKLKSVESGEISQEEFDSFFDFDRAEKVEEETSSRFVPRQVVKSAVCEGPIPGDDYNGYLSEEECYVMFNQLLSELEEIPEDNQLVESEKIWLYEGRAAVEAWYEIRRQELAKKQNI
jgi:hypothetical protein